MTIQPEVCKSAKSVQMIFLHTIQPQLEARLDSYFKCQQSGEGLIIHFIHARMLTVRNSDAGDSEEVCCLWADWCSLCGGRGAAMEKKSQSPLCTKPGK